MREQRKRKALYVNRREELYTDVLIEKERAPARIKKKPAPKARRPRAASPRSRPKR